MAKVNIKSEKITPFGGIYYASSKRVRDAAFFLSLCLLPLQQHY